MKCKGKLDLGEGNEPIPCLDPRQHHEGQPHTFITKIFDKQRMVWQHVHMNWWDGPMPGRGDRID